jgi:hypothetical protein
MADSKELIKPRRKRRRFTRLEYPFPVPEQKNRDEDKWYYYQGFLRDNCVAVDNIGDLTFLYKMVSHRVVVLNVQCFTARV